MGLNVELPPRAAGILGDRAAAYQKRIARDFDTLRSWLPKHCDAILDIGCGLAGVNVRVAEATGAQTIHLLDGDGTGPRKMGFMPETQAWFDVEAGAELVRANLPGRNIVAHRADPGHGIKADLILSLKSWGHHYPVETYLGLARRSLAPGARIIMDIRTGTDGEQAMVQSGFEMLGIAYETVKARRVVFA